MELPIPPMTPKESIKPDTSIVAKTVAPSEILGLSPAERRIIQVTSSMALGMSQIARKAKIPRSSIPYMLEKLKARGFMKKRRNGRLEKKYVWKSDIAKPLRSLQAMPKGAFLGGQSILNSGAGVVTYNGTGHILDIFFKMCDLPKNSRVIAFQPDNSIRHALRKNLISNFLKVNEGIKRQALIIEGIVHEKSVETIIHELGLEGGQKIFDSFIGRLEDYVKVPDDFANVQSEIYIFGGFAYIINWDKELAICIQDKDMVALLSAMLSCVKEFGQRYSQNENMKRHSPKYASTTSLRAKTSAGLPSANSTPESRT